MANLPETPDYPAGIYQLETSDPVLGGAGGIANRQGEQLANRTAWLKAKVDAFIDGTVAVLKATKLATARTLSVSGAASGSASFDGSANANIALTLADSGAVAGTYPKVTINAKGLVTAGAALVAADIPNLDWSKINSGKPTTLAGYGITDALAAGGTAVAAAKLATARTLSLSGAASGSASFDGSANANIALTLADSGAVAGTYPKVTINAKGLVTGGAALVAADIPNLDWSKINSGKPTTLGGYGITDAAPIASPTFTGVPAGPTAAAGTNTTQLATTAFVAAVKAALDATDALKAPLASPGLTGTPTAPTAAAGTNTTQLATTAFVAAVKALLAPLASPALTGTPTAPTAAAGTNTTQLATTAFVNAEIANDAYLKADFADRLVSRGGNANGTYNIWSSGKTECFGTALITAPSTLVTLPVALPSTAGVSVMHSAQSTNPNVSVTTVLESTTQVRVYTTSTVTVSIEARGGI